MPITAEDGISEAQDELEELQNRHDLDRQEALELLLVSEIKDIKTLLEDVEVHTNNTVRLL